MLTPSRSALLGCTQILLAIAIAVAPDVARAEPVSVAGRTINVVLPKGYCALGTHPADKELIEGGIKAIGPRNVFLIAFADCAELEQLHRAQRTALENWGHLTALAPSGTARALVGVARRDFIARVANEAGFKPGVSKSLRKAEERVREVVPSLKGIQSLGVLSTDQNGVYLGVIAEITDPAPARKMIGISSISMAREIPISLSLYCPYKENTAVLEELLAKQRSAIHLLLQANP